VEAEPRSVRADAEAAVARGARGDARVAAPAPAGADAPARAPKLPAEVVDELADRAGERRGARLAKSLDDAVRAFDRDRYPEARRILSRLAEEVPSAAAVRELHGLTLYRMDRWKPAITELEAYRALTGEVDQLPVLADCYRAIRKWDKVAELWQELREASPSAELVAEGRIVMAGSLADRGDLASAIRLMAGTDAVPAKVRPHHLRLWYVLADLSDRAGESPRARALFRRIREHDPDYADVKERLAALGR
jgi:tetratricopeptide (TPR) repeat protein